MCASPFLTSCLGRKALDGRYPLPLSPIVLECAHPLMVALAYLQRTRSKFNFVVATPTLHPVTWCEGLDAGCCCLYVRINGRRLGSYFHLQNANDPFTVTKLCMGGREGGEREREEGKKGKEGGKEQKRMREGRRIMNGVGTSFSSLSVLCLV